MSLTLIHIGILVLKALLQNNFKRKKNTFYIRIRFLLKNTTDLMEGVNSVKGRGLAQYDISLTLWPTLLKLWNRWILKQLRRLVALKTTLRLVVLFFFFF